MYDDPHTVGYSIQPWRLSGLGRDTRSTAVNSNGSSSASWSQPVLGDMGIADP